MQASEQGPGGQECKSLPLKNQPATVCPGIKRDSWSLMSRQQRHHPYSDYGTDRGVQGRRGGGRGPEQNDGAGGYGRGGMSYGGGRGGRSGPLQQRGYNDPEPSRSYGGDYGAPSNYGYSAPDSSYSQPSAPYNAGYQGYDAPQGYGDADYAPPRSLQRPPNPYGDGGFRPSGPGKFALILLLQSILDGIWEIQSMPLRFRQCSPNMKSY